MATLSENKCKHVIFIIRAEYNVYVYLSTMYNIFYSNYNMKYVLHNAIVGPKSLPKNDFGKGLINLM